MTRADTDQARPALLCSAGRSGAPIVTAADGGSEPTVWAVGAEGDNRLHGFRGDTGEEIYAIAADGCGLRPFATILVAAGLFYVAGDRHIFAFDRPP